MPFHWYELLPLLLLGILFFGPKRLPEMGAAVGKTIREFQNSMRHIQEPETATEQPATALVTATEPTADAATAAAPLAEPVAEIATPQAGPAAEAPSVTVTEVGAE